MSNLEDTDQHGDFNNLRLQLDHSGETAPVPPPTVDFRGQSQPQQLPQTMTSPPLESPVEKITSDATLKSNVPNCTDHSKKFFCNREGAFRRAQDDLLPKVKKFCDAPVVGFWLLTEIDHWDQEREKVLCLTETNLFVFKYDFVREKETDMKNLLLHPIEALEVGNLRYPAKSYMPSRNHGGVKLSWQRSQELSFSQKWNPWSTDIPWALFSHHPIIYFDESTANIAHYDVNDFRRALVSVIEQTKEKNNSPKLLLYEHDIVIESYAGLAATVFNQSYLGYSRERGGVSF